MSTESDDKEIKAMGQLISALKDLNAQEQDRVLSKFCPNVSLA